MKTFTTLNIPVICLAFATFSCQHGEGFLAELASAATAHDESEFTVQVTDLDGFKIFQVASCSSILDKILKESGIEAKRLNAGLKLEVMAGILTGFS